MHIYLTILTCSKVVWSCTTITPVFQLNISFPATGCQKLIEVDDERKLRTFYEKRMATEVAADPLGDEWKVRDVALFPSVVFRRTFLSCTPVDPFWLFYGH